MRKRCMLFITIFTVVLFGCQHFSKPVDSSGMFKSDLAGSAKPWTDVGFLNDPNQFQFAIIADLSGGNRPGVIEEAVKKLNLMKPEFVISVGDLIEGYTDDEAILNGMRAGFEKSIEPLGMRFFFVPGNHDLSNPLQTKKWEELYGRTYYHFIYRDVLFLCLSTEEASRISDAQVEYVRRVLAKNPKVRWTFVFMHQPLWKSKHPGWTSIEAMLADRPHTVFAGHDHTYAKCERHGRSYIKLATTGGGSSLRGPSRGEFDQIVWVTMNDKGPTIANLPLDGILDENVVTEEVAILIDRLYSGKWLTSDSIVSEAEYFKNGKTKISLVNKESIPLKVHGVFKPHHQLTFSTQEVEMIVPPKSTKSVEVEVKAKNPASLKNIDPLLLKASAVYEIAGRTPIKEENVHQVDLRYGWQGPELIYNGGFDNGMNGWTPSYKKPASGTFSVESGALKARVNVNDDFYALALGKIMFIVHAGSDYQLSFKAKTPKTPNQIRFAIREMGGTSSYAQIVVDG